MVVIINRFEGDYDVCEKENKDMVNIERSKLPEEIKEGDALIVEREGMRIDVEATQKKKKEIDEFTKDLWV